MRRTFDKSLPKLFQKAQIPAAAGEPVEERPESMSKPGQRARNTAFRLAAWLVMYGGAPGEVEAEVAAADKDEPRVRPHFDRYLREPGRPTRRHGRRPLPAARAHLKVVAQQGRWLQDRPWSRFGQIIRPWSVQMTPLLRHRQKGWPIGSV